MFKSPPPPPFRKQYNKSFFLFDYLCMDPVGRRVKRGYLHGPRLQLSALIFRARNSQVWARLSAGETQGDFKGRRDSHIY